MSWDQKDEEPKRLPYYSREEILEHNLPTDCWVSIFGRVYDLTQLIREHKGNTLVH